MGARELFLNWKGLARWAGDRRFGQQKAGMPDSYTGLLRAVTKLQRYGQISQSYIYMVQSNNLVRKTHRVPYAQILAATLLGILLPLINSRRDIEKSHDDVTFVAVACPFPQIFILSSLELGCA
jgi:hypothetical protein